MDITQLVITAASVVGIALVGLMAVIPSVMEAGAGRDEARPAAPRPAGHHRTGQHRLTPSAPRRRAHHQPVDLAA